MNKLFVFTICFLIAYLNTILYIIFSNKLIIKLLSINFFNFKKDLIIELLLS